VNLKGPEPEGVRQLLDGAVALPELTPEQEEAMDRRLFAALAQKRAQRARRRTMTQVGMATAATVAIAAGIVLVLRFVRPDSDANNARPTRSSRAREIPTMAEPAPVPSLSVTAERPDAGPVFRTQRR
jgi:hypothetical protein